MKALHLFLAVAVVLAGAAMAQETPPPPPAPEGPMPMWNTAPGEPGIAFFRTEMMGLRQPVKGAPYTATAVTESTQVLADGNRIVNKSSGLVARDGEGRIRNEEAVHRIGPLAVKGPNVIFIHDPVAQTDYVLNPSTQVARVLKPHEGMRFERRQAREMRRKMRRDMRERGAQAGTDGEGPLKGQIKRESLGTQEIEGVTAEGTRITRTIPAGAIGNEKPIEITVETWRSPDLHVLVLSKRSDPRFGETVYKLTDIKRGEPDASLFQVPSDYKTEKGAPRTFRWHPQAPQAPKTPPPPASPQN
jgi:hypothetical protein